MAQLGHREHGPIIKRILVNRKVGSRRNSTATVFRQPKYDLRESSTNRQANFSNRQVGSHRNSKNTRPSNRDEIQANRPMFFQDRPIGNWRTAQLAHKMDFRPMDSGTKAAKTWPAFA
jgi:hypothetical protein